MRPGFPVVAIRFKIRDLIDLPCQNLINGARGCPRYFMIFEMSTPVAPSRMMEVLYEFKQKLNLNGFLAKYDRTLLAIRRPRHSPSLIFCR